MLLREHLTTAVNQWLAAQSAGQTLIIIGGGKLIDAVRELDQQHAMPPQQTHWTCVDLLSVTANFAADLFGWPLLKTEQQWDAVVQQNRTLSSPGVTSLPTVITPAVFYNERTSVSEAGSPISGLPNDWRTTTDSIAALLAHRVDADELVLLKSCPIPPEMSHTKLAQAGIVDNAFPTIARDLRSVRIEQLR